MLDEVKKHIKHREKIVDRVLEKEENIKIVQLENLRNMK